MNGGERVAEALVTQGVSHLFALCGGHISPILVAAESRGVDVVPVRDEASAVFAADALARMRGRIGAAAVTAGPGVTNTITAVKNAQMAQTPILVLGGAAATILRGRGALQDIDQLALMSSQVKWAARVERRRDIIPMLEWGFEVALEGVPGPVFLEIPVDLLYSEADVRSWYGTEGSNPSGLRAKARRWYLRRHLNRIFSARGDRQAAERRTAKILQPGGRRLDALAERLERSSRPLMLIGSQSTLRAEEIGGLAAAVHALEVPCYLSGMARGLLGASHSLQVRHRRREALKEADLVILAGVPCDFRLDYGRHIPSSTFVAALNRSATDLTLNRKPDLGILADAGLSLEGLQKRMTSPPSVWGEWRQHLRRRDAEREQEIADEAERGVERINPLALCKAIDEVMADDSVLVADGGDFVATASYITHPRSPLSWLDPGVFGTLGVGGGFALGARCARPASEIWILYGDGSCAYSLAEFDTFVRCGWPVIAVVGTDASWAQIAREQVEMLGSAVGTTLRRTDYHKVAEGYGGRGLLLDRPERTREVLEEARHIAAGGTPVLVNALLADSDFRKGSISI